MKARRSSQASDDFEPPALAAARDALARFVHALKPSPTPCGCEGATLDLSALDGSAIEVVERVLGRGAARIDISGAPSVRAQETVFAGIWRVRVIDAGGRVTSDRVEASAVPSIAVDAARAAASSALVDVAAVPGVQNGPALLADIASQMHRDRDTAHIVNLTLFPLTSADHAMIDRALPAGPVEIVVRGFGECRVASTLARDVWRVRYFNAVDALVLNTIEVTDVPEIAVAAADDLDDSRLRLGELVDWMSEACAA